MLTAKEYDDGKEVTYTGEGKLETRTWARSASGSHVTTYDYDSNTGELTEIDYSDSTSYVTSTYNPSSSPSPLKLPSVQPGSFPR